MKLLIFIILFLVTVSDLFSQGYIKGTVTNSKNGSPVEKASIKLTETIGTVTVENGKFILTNLPPGNYVLRASSLGFETIETGIILIDSLILDLRLVPTFFNLNEIVVSATKTKNFIGIVPSRVNIIPANVINLLPVQTTDEFLNYIPGVNISRSFGIFSHKSSVTMRGMSGNEQARVLVMVDGIPVNKADGGSVNWNMINPDNVDRIEVVKGPSSSVYGSNAMGGMINIITKTPEVGLHGSVRIDYGTFNTYGGRFNLSEKIASGFFSGFFWSANGLIRKSDGYITQSVADRLANPFITRSNLKEFETSLKLGYEFNLYNKVLFDVSRYDDSRGTGEKVFQPAGNTTDHDTWQYSLRYDGKTEKLSWKASLYLLDERYKKVTEFMKDDYTFYKVLSKRIDMGFLSNVTYDLTSNKITAGIDAKIGSVDAKDVYYTSTDIVYNAGTMKTLGLFVQDELSILNQRLSIIAGLRFDRAEFLDGAFRINNPSAETQFMIGYQNSNLQNVSWNSMSPKLSANYRFSSNTRVFASFAKGFRPSVLDDLCRSGRMRGGFKLANPIVRPEYLTTLEIGTDMGITEKVRAAVSLYYTRGNDFMYYVNSGDSIDMGFGDRPIYKRMNIPLVEMYGSELEVNYRLSNEITIIAGYSFSHSQILKYYRPDPADPVDLTNKYITDVPLNTVSFSFLWKNRIVNISTFGKFTGEMWVNDLNQYDEIVGASKYPAFTSVDLKFSKDLNRFSFDLDIRNVLNDLFYDSKGAVCPGRFMTLQIGIKF